MRTVHRYTVIATLPERLRPLEDIARNLWWTWNTEAIELFRRIDSDLWATVGNNPILLLRRVDQERLVRLLANESFLAHMDRVHAELRSYLENSTWYEWVHGTEVQNAFAYFSFEFGIHECLPQYSGGLGVLAGDLLKSTSELGLPLYGIGLLYRSGYFRQQLGPDGWQQELYTKMDFDTLPVTLERDEAGNPLQVTVRYPGRDVHANIWSAKCGRVSMILLDCDVEENSPEDREITARLYGGDLDMRMRQEVMLGIGGMRALARIGVIPSVCHMNEGHSAFLGLERTRDLMTRYDLTFEAAKEAVVASTVFTTHTPVPAGNDAFPPDLVRKYFSEYVSQLGVSVDHLLALGRVHPWDQNEPLNMPVLALKLSTYANGVSKLHAKVSRKMWSGLWPELTEAEIPLTHVTNGIHTRTWLSDEFARLYERYLGPRWLEDPMDQGVWEQVETIPDTELWRARERLRVRLVAFARARLREQLQRRGAHKMRVLEAEEALDPDALTIGFARRFAAYKRAYLILSDPDRLSRILGDPERPVQFIIAGKAHPQDKRGKELIRQVVQFAGRPEFRRRVVFLEDYDLGTARCLVQGVDVWLNTPRRPLEASGTSGMKVPVNGGIHLSVLDGWWVEGFQGDNGWAIGRGEEYEDPDYGDELESRALYGLLEHEVVPLFYRRGPDGLPHEWIEMMKKSIRTVCPYFNTNRMVKEYLELFYLPAAMQWNYLTSDNGKEARDLVAWRRFISEAWSDVAVLSTRTAGRPEVLLGGALTVEVRVRLGRIQPSDVSVELFHGPVDPDGRIVEGAVSCMSHQQVIGNGEHLFVGQVPCSVSGNHGFTVRVLPWRSVLGRMLQSGPILTA